MVTCIALKQNNVMTPNNRRTCLLQKINSEIHFYHLFFTNTILASVNLLCSAVVLNLKEMV